MSRRTKSGLKFENCFIASSPSFTTNTTSESTNHASPAAASSLGTNGHDMSTLTIPSGMTIYGRFNAVDISAGKAILYLG